MNKSAKGIIIILAVAIPAIIVAVALTSGKSEAPVVSDLEQGTTASRQTASDSGEGSTTTDETDAKKVSVEIKDHAYNPATITVKVGTTVSWTNQDSTRHDVVATSGSADAPSSDLLARGESYSFTFNKPGTYDYYCTPHPFMKGKVVVTE